MGASIQPRHAWLTLALPFGARRFEVHDPTLAATLAEGGAEVVSDGADVELGPLRSLSGECRFAVAVYDPGGRDTGPLRRVASRSVGHALARVRTTAAERHLRRLGYRYADTHLWHLDRPLHVRPDGAVGDSDHLPVAISATGSNEPVQSVLEGAVAAVREVVGDFEPTTYLLREGIVVAMGDQAVARVAVGPSLLERQHAFFESLRRSNPGPAVTERVPWPLAFGRAGPAVWLAEERLDGDRVPPEPEGRLLKECIEFATELNGLAPIAEPPSIVEQASVVAGAVPPAASRLARLAARLTHELAGLPRGFGHGDYATTNLLCRGSHLTGVADWERAGTARLPLFDVFKLRLEPSVVRGGGLARGLKDVLLPWAGRGGDEVSRDYLQRLGLSLDRRTLESLVWAYWLDRVSFDLRTYSDRAARPRWLDANVLPAIELLP